MTDSDTLFEQRKRDHLRIALDPRAQSHQTTGLESVELIHEALPDLDFADIDLRTPFQNQVLKSPIFISSMTAGHQGGEALNIRLARFAQTRGLLMGVGSQRKELLNGEAAQEWKHLRAAAPNALLLGNLGIAQLIQSKPDQILRLVENLQAAGLFIHLNPLQEALQAEGTPQFRGGLRALEALVKTCPVPVIIKETGSGFSQPTLQRLDDLGVFAIDVSGRGGTHWGRVETLRLDPSLNADHRLRAQAGLAFGDWGISTVESLQNARKIPVSCQLWASGGVRTGLDVAKLMALGADMVGLAAPWLQAATQSDPDQALSDLGNRLEFELKVALFCTGSRMPAELKTSEKWTWRRH